MKSDSLALRTVLFLCVAQIMAFGIAWLITVVLGLTGVELFATSFEELATIRAKKQVIESLVSDKDGSIRIEPTVDLIDEMARAPAMKFAVFRSLSKEPLDGSSPELLDVLKPLIAISPTHVHFVLPGDPSAIRMGLLEPVWTPFGRMHVAVYGQKFRLTDIYYDALEETRWLIAYFVMAIFMSASAAWVAVNLGLKPLRAVTREAALIDMNSLHQRLSVNGVSREIRPLVEAFNGALARLDAGVARQRRFTANAAHELRTPVTILGARLDAPEQPTFKNDLKRDHRRIRNIVEQLLATARLGEQSATPDEILDLTLIARATIADAALLAVRTGRDIEFDAPSTPVQVRGSRLALESVVANLVDNALRMEPAGGSVIVRITDEALLQVIDHGDGIDLDDREKIFEPFWRKSASTPGTGLGLAIAKEIIDAHGGRIWADSTPGGGATLNVLLRRRPLEGAQQIAAND